MISEFKLYLPYHFSQCAMERIVYGGKKTGKIVLLSKKKKMCFGLINFVLQFLQRHLKGKM